MNGARPWATLLLVGGIFWGNLACQNKEQAPTFAISSDAAARKILDQFFQAYVAQDLDAALSYLCIDSPERRAAARDFITRSQAPDSLFRVDRYEIRSIQPSWAGRKPLFVGEISFPRKEAAGEILHRYHVRVETGCIEDFLPAASPSGFRRAPPTHTTAPPGDEREPSGDAKDLESPNEAPKPSAPPTEAAGREVIEL